MSEPVEIEKTGLEKPEDPTKPTAAEKRAAVNRDNEFRELAKAVTKGMAGGLAVVQIQLKSGEKFVIHASPGMISELLCAQQQKLQQMEIVLNELVELLVNGELTLEKLFERCAISAEKTASVMNRALLSQGAQQGGIIKPS